MSTSTRIFLAVTAVVAVVLVLYYGVLFQDPIAPQTTRAADIEPAPSKPGPSVRPPERTEAPYRFDPSPPSAPIPPLVIPEEPAEEAPPEKALEDLAPINIEAGAEADGKDGPRSLPGADDPEDVPDPAGDEEPSEKPEEPSAPAAPVPPVPAAPQYTEYTVRANDTMSTIAAEWFGDASKWDLIAKANPLVDPARLRVGQVLRLPPKDTKREEIKETAGDDEIIYTVRSGDTLSKIARAYYGHERHWRLIYDANRETIGGSADNLKPGMRLTIPPAPGE